VPNPIWSGVVAFGMVSIPVRLYPATESKDVKFHMLHRKDASRISQRYYCPEDDAVIDAHELVRGYEASPGRYIVMTDDDFAAIPVTSQHSVELSEFVELASIDPIHFQKTYYLEPDPLGLKPFALLLRVMQESGRAGIARFTLRHKEQACVIRPYKNTLALSPLLYLDEVRSTSMLRKADRVEVEPDALALPTAYVDALTTEFNHESYSDPYREGLTALLDEKAKSLPADAGAKTMTFPDLMGALREAIEAKRAKVS